MWKIEFAPDLSSGEKKLVQGALEEGIIEENRILRSHSKVKSFFKVNAGSSSFFVKLREYRSLPRKLLKGLTKTKEEQELENYLFLREAEIPCPRPLCSGRRKRGLFTEASVLVTVFLENTRPLRQVWMDGVREEHLGALVLLFHRLRKAKAMIQDLQWNNLLLEERGREVTLYLVDPLHLKIWRGKGDLPMGESLDWFLRFMKKEGAGADLMRYVMERLQQEGFHIPSCHPDLEGTSG